MVSALTLERLCGWWRRLNAAARFDDRRLLVDYIDDRNENGYLGCGGGDGVLYAEFARVYLARLGGLAAAW